MAESILTDHSVVCNSSMDLAWTYIKENIAN